MRIYGITVTGRTIAANSDDMNLIRTSIGVDQLYVLFDSSEWMNFPVSVTFKNGDVMVTTSLLLAAVESTEWAAEATCTIPWEIIQELGSVNVTLQGTDSSGNHIITAEGAPLAVVEAGDVEEGTIPEGVPTISEWEQAYANAMAVVNEGTAIIEALDGFAGGTLPIENGGTGASTASAALTNLGAAAATHNHSGQALTPASVAATGDVTAVKNGTTYSLGTLGESVSLSPGSYSINGLICAAHVSGSGNYLEVGLPIGLNDNVTGAKMSNASGVTCFLPNGSKVTAFDFSYGAILERCKFGFTFELKFSAAQASNTPVIVRFTPATLVLS